MASITFQQQLLLTIIDKGILAVVLVGVGLIASRVLEVYKVRETLRATFAAERLPRVRAAFQTLEDLRFRSDEVFDKIFWTAHRWLRNRSESDEPAEAAVAEKRIDFADRRLFNGPLGAEYRDVFFHFTPRLSLEGEIEKAHAQIQKERFWLGRTLIGQLNAEYTSLSLSVKNPQISFERGRLNRAEVSRFRSLINEWRWKRLLARIGAKQPLGFVDIDAAVDLVMKKPK